MPLSLKIFSRATGQTKFVAEREFGEERITIGLPLESVAADLAEAGLADAKSLNALSKTALPLQNGVLVLVGDRATILEQIKDLGLPEPVMYDAEGNAVR